MDAGHATRLIGQLRAAGADDFCICAGSRNSPLLLAIAGSNARRYSFVDERSAAFFAIGRAKLHGKPVAVVTTSGTAAAELLPAAVEAFYSGLPLILVTADRPARFRGTGAPQSIEQIGLFGVYAETALDEWSGRRPLHVNVEFEESDLQPRSVILSEEGERSRVPEERSFASLTAIRASDSALWSRAQPLVIIGGLAAKHRERVRAFVAALNAPTYAEPLSGVREDAALPLITAGERMIAHASFDVVIRIGNVPTLRFWRELEERDVPVIHYSDLPFRGMTRGDVHPVESLPQVEGKRDDAFFARDREYAARFARFLDEEPQSELAMFRALSRDLAPDSRVYLGNSLPIREWDLAASRDRPFEYEANRGANGIDGQLSTFLGWCDPEHENICVVGDLTAIYDLGAPWIVPQLGHRRFRIVVVNNGGGRIFSRVGSLRAIDAALRERLIENVHDVRFQPWASMWGIEVTELRPDLDASNRVWERYDALWG